MDSRAGARPIPVRVTVWGRRAALSENASMPSLPPVADGVNVTPTVHEASAPMARMLLKLTATFWLFVKVTVMAGLVSPTGSLPKLKLVGERVTGGMPLPVRLAVCGLLLALSVTVSFPLSAPKVAGVKEMRMVQVAPLASLAGLRGHVP